MARILVLTNGSVGSRMAGTGIRSAHLAQSLAGEHGVTLASPNLSGELPSLFGNIAVSRLDRATLPRLEQTHDILIVQGTLLAEHPELRRTRRILVVDLYNPYLFEFLEHARVAERSGESVSGEFPHVLYSLLAQLLAGDVFLCSSRRQYDLWLGMLTMLGRLSPGTTRPGSSIAARILFVPMGVPEQPPRKTHAVLRGIHPAIHDEDLVLLWGGGMHNWLDPLTPIAALRTVIEHDRRYVLVFPGVPCPEQRPSASHMLEAARRAAARTGLLNDRMVFIDRWLPYAERQNLLFEADIGISMHQETLETRYAFRTRLLDYLWVGLPSVLSAGDELSSVMHDAGAARAVPPGDTAALVGTLRELSNATLRERMRTACHALRNAYLWSNVTKPLREFCAAPTYAPDISIDPRLGRRTANVALPFLNELLLGVRLLSPPIRAWKVYREEGLAGVTTRMSKRLRKRTSAPAAP